VEVVAGKFGSTPEAAFGGLHTGKRDPLVHRDVYHGVHTHAHPNLDLQRQIIGRRAGSRAADFGSRVLAVRSMLEDIVGPHGLQFFPVVMTFAVLIPDFESDGTVPAVMSPTSATSVTFALGLSSFVYYNSIGIKQNGLFGHLKHFAGPIWWIAPLIFPIELISNFIRPFSLGFVCLAICLPTRKLWTRSRTWRRENLLAGPGRVDAFERIRGFYSDVRLYFAVAVVSQ